MDGWWIDVLVCAWDCRANVGVIDLFVYSFFLHRGWGGEDDELQNRLERVKVKWEWPKQGTLTDLEGRANVGEKMNYLRQNRHLKCNVKWELLEENKTTWKWNGLSDLKYKVLGEEALGEHGTKVKVDVELNGHWANDMSEEKKDS